MRPLCKFLRKPGCPSSGIASAPLARSISAHDARWPRPEPAIYPTRRRSCNHRKGQRRNSTPASLRFSSISSNFVTLPATSSGPPASLQGAATSDPIHVVHPLPKRRKPLPTCSSLAGIISLDEGLRLVGLSAPSPCLSAAVEQPSHCSSSASAPTCRVPASPQAAPKAIHRSVAVEQPSLGSKSSFAPPCGAELHTHIQLLLQMHLTKGLP